MALYRMPNRCYLFLKHAFSYSPANTCHSYNAVSMLDQRLGRWPAIETALGDCPVFCSELLRYKNNN